MGFSSAIEENLAALQRVSTPALKEIAPALAHAEGEIATALRKMPSKSYTGAQRKGMLIHLRTLHASVSKRLGQGMRKELVTGTTRAVSRSITGMEKMVGAKVPGVHLDEALIMARRGSLLIERTKTQGFSYGRAVADDVRLKLMTSVLAGDSREDAARRLLQSSGLIRRFEKQGLDKLTDGASDHLKRQYYNRADRMAVTEIAGAWNLAAEESIRTLNHDDPGYLMKVDARIDIKVCKLCKSLDGQMVRPGGSFVGGWRIPPFHCYCRCGLVPWRRDW